MITSIRFVTYSSTKCRSISFARKTPAAANEHPLRSKPSGPTGVIQEVQNYPQFGQARRHRPENDQKLSPRLRQTARWQPSQRHRELNIAKMMVADER